MENKINRIIVLDDQSKFIILNQAIYQDKNYFFVAGLTEDEQDINGEYRILEESVESDGVFVNQVEDKNIIDLLSKYLKPTDMKTDNVAQ